MQETLNRNHGILDSTNTSPKCHTCSNRNHGILDSTNTSPKCHTCSNRNHGTPDLMITSSECHTCSKFELAFLPSFIRNRIILTMTQLSYMNCTCTNLELTQPSYMNRTCKNLELTHASSTRSKCNTNLINKFQIEVLRNHFDEYHAILHDWEPDSMMGWIYCTERSCSIIVKYLYGFNISFYSEGDWQMLLNMTVAKALFDCEGVLASILS
jgi:hypothetical protein